MKQPNKKLNNYQKTNLVRNYTDNEQILICYSVFIVCRNIRGKLEVVYVIVKCLFIYYKWVQLFCHLIFLLEVRLGTHCFIYFSFEQN